MKSDRFIARATAFAVPLSLALAMTVGLAASAAADTLLKVALWDKPDGTQGMTLSANEVKAGMVTFEVTNASTTDQEHELLFVKTDMNPDQLPMKDEGAKIDEAKLTDWQEFGEVEEGGSKTWTAELTPGRYVLFCNEEGHFMAGMYATLTVTE